MSALLTAWVNGRALPVTQKQQVNKQTEQQQPLGSRNTDCSALSANNNLCTPAPAPGNTETSHVAYSPVPCFLLEASSEKNKLTQSRASLNPRALQESPWGIAKLEHPQCPPHTGEVSSYLWSGSSWWREWPWPSPQAPCSHFLWTMKESWQVLYWHPLPHPVGKQQGTVWDGKVSPGQDTSLTTQGHAALAASLHPMGEIPLLCSLQTRNVQNLRIHSNEQATCIQPWKPTRLRANKLLIQVQKGQQERNQNICCSPNWTSRSTGQKHQEHLPQAAQAPAAHMNGNHKAEPGVNKLFSHLIPYMLLAQCVPWS